MLVEWIVAWDNCNLSASCTEVNIFFDANLSPPDAGGFNDGPFNNNRPTEPIFIWNATIMTSFSSFNMLNNPPKFRTELFIYPVLDVPPFASMHSRGTLAYYPFDSYQSEIFAFAQEALTNKSVSLVIGSASRLIIDLKITTGAMSTDPTYMEDTGFLQQEVIGAYVILQRSTLVIGYCLVITVTFWMVTLMICLIMITTVIFGYRQRNEIVVVPIGTVFAFTQLRSTMPGAPDGFGDVLDLVGLLPCLVLLSICAVAMVGIYLFTDPDDPSRKAFTWDELVRVLRFYIWRIWNTVKTCAQRGRLRIRIARRKASNVIEIPSANLDC
ncbi:hypothetical protein ARMSODRAFT_1085399 [Armillaria solidipes]|uniref:Uncharacterized protein n=1 Tax=Armillaria solidipes TaxID=1076256 RepID=A0A2H3BC90_9AGAR|nr:hypothetical protein ARMSODRAFT_1085399 [Armillaria solidipes]